MSNNYKFVRRHYHNSPKAGMIYCESSYELRAATLLDDDPNVLFYETQQCYVGRTGKRRKFDFLIHFKDGRKKIVEVKPVRRLGQFLDQISDNRHYATEKGYEFGCWTEELLGWNTEQEARKWIDEYLKNHTGLDFAAIRKDRAAKRSIKHYNKVIAQDKVTVYCDFCKCDHDPLRQTYDKAFAKHGRFICEREGGFIAGSKPKKKKINPYAEQGMKQCLGCDKILPFESFDKDSTKPDGRMSRCKECRKK